ncbi:MAG: GLUG motif-containing protein [Planctomycetota bacterium]
MNHFHNGGYESWDVGGLCGFNYEATIRDCYSVE